MHPHRMRRTPHLLNRLGREVGRRLAIRQLRRGLHATPDWLLHDIGVPRTEIDLAAMLIVDGRHPLSYRIRRD